MDGNSDTIEVSLPKQGEIAVSERGLGAVNAWPLNWPIAAAIERDRLSRLQCTRQGLGGSALSSLFGLARLAFAPALAVALSGCMGMGGGDEATAEAAAKPATEEQVDVRRYLGPDYCPEIRVREGTEVIRQYASEGEEDSSAVIWQASVGETARDCLYDAQGGLELKVGVSGRAIAGPKGGAQTVSLPLRIAVVKHREAVLANELYPLTVSIPGSGAAVFSEVRVLNVPPIGKDRDYILYVGFDEKGENLLDPTADLVAKKKAAEEAARRAEIAAAEPVEAPVQQPRKKLPPKPAALAGPKVLPTPTDGFVLPGG